MQIVAAQGAVALCHGPALITVVDQNAKSAAEQRKRDAQLHSIALLRWLPCPLDPRFLYRELLAVLAGFDAAGRNGAGTLRGKEHLTFRAGGVFEADPDPIAHRRRVERLRVWSVVDELVVADVQLGIEHPLMDTREDAESVPAVAEVLPGAGRIRPFIRVAVQEGFTGKRRVGSGRSAPAAEILRPSAPVQQVFATLQRGGDGLRHCGQRFALGFAQNALDFQDVAVAGPGQDQRQRGSAAAALGEATCRGGHSTHR